MCVQTILLVDDEESVRTVIRRILESENYTVLEADTYQTALKTFDQNRDVVTLLLIDISLPDGNGFELAIALRKKKKDLRVLFVSGHAGAEVCRFYRLDVADLHYLGKPFTAPELQSRVLQVLKAPERFPRILEPSDDRKKTSQGSNA
jgi:DNA-binding response OmpR family regulator